MIAFATIIVHIDGSEDCTARLDLAATVARRQGAGLTALHVAKRAADPFALPCRLDCLEIEAAATRIQATLRQAEEHFDRLARRMPEASWRVVDAEATLFDDIAPVLVREARYADLVIIGQDGAGGTEEHRLAALPQELLLRSGRPLLIVPHGYRAAGIGDRVIVCWKPDRESARALRDALPLLRGGKAVQVVQIGEAGESDDAAARARADLECVVGYLAAHRVEATARYERCLPDLNAAAQLLRHASGFGADLMVMGGYNHSRLHEFLLGGVTREILGAMTVPVLISH